MKLLHQLLFDRQFDGFDAAVHTKLLEYVRDVKLDSPQTHHQPLRRYDCACE